MSNYTLLEIRSFTTTILDFSRPQIDGRGLPRRKKVMFSRPHICGRDRCLGGTLKGASQIHITTTFTQMWT